jgi:hypothetical protein
MDVGKLMASSDAGSIAGNFRQKPTEATGIPNRVFMATTDKEVA